MHLVYVEAIEIDCQPIINVVGIRAATATIECQMVGGMGGEAPVANKFCRQLIVARVGADDRTASAAAANNTRFILLSGKPVNDAGCENF